MREYVSTGEVRGGKLTVRNRERYEAAMAQFEDGDVLVTIARTRATRSLAQNAYYFGVVLERLAEHTGYSVDELHEYFKHRFNSKRLVMVDKQTGEVRDDATVGQSTTKLNKITFGDYLNQIIAFAQDELGVVIPPADPEWNVGHECQCGAVIRKSDETCEDCRRKAAEAA